MVNEILEKTIAECPLACKKGIEIVRIDDTCSVGGKKFIVFAGPCRVESQAQISETARFLKKAGAHVLRGGAFKPCANPRMDLGRGETGLQEAAYARKKTGLPIMAEAVTEWQVPIVDKYADIIQTGMRNGQNFGLLEKIATSTQKPVFVKRGSWMNIREFLCSIEWVLYNRNKSAENPIRNVIACERGIVTFNQHTRWTLDISMVPAFKGLSGLPLVVDISHGTGKEGNTEYFESLAKGVVAAGADGLMVEVHPEPAKSISDSHQTLDFDEFSALMKAIKPIVKAVGRKL
jgi:3-deoxy-7-phosphoheptulonate synthase